MTGDQCKALSGEEINTGFWYWIMSKENKQKLKEHKKQYRHNEEEKQKKQRIHKEMPNRI